jgi:hypothetical protein
MLNECFPACEDMRIIHMFDMMDIFSSLEKLKESALKEFPKIIDVEVIIIDNN